MNCQFFNLSIGFNHFDNYQLSIMASAIVASVLDNETTKESLSSKLNKNAEQKLRLFEKFEFILKLLGEPFTDLLTFGYDGPYHQYYTYACFAKLFPRFDNIAKIQFVETCMQKKLSLLENKFVLDWKMALMVHSVHMKYNDYHSDEQKRVCYDFLFSFTYYLANNLTSLVNCVAIRCIRDVDNRMKELCEYFSLMRKKQTEMHIICGSEDYDKELYARGCFKLIDEHIKNAMRAYEICEKYFEFDDEVCKSASSSSSVEPKQNDFEMNSIENNSSSSSSSSIKEKTSIEEFNNFIACNYDKITYDMPKDVIVHMFNEWKLSCDDIFVPKELHFLFI